MELKQIASRGDGRPTQGNHTPENDGYNAGAPKRQNNFTVKN
jgi:hypothetical protein